MSTKDLTDQMKAFAEKYVELGCGWGDASEAARAAGYSTTGDAHRVRAHHLLRDKRVQSYIEELIKERLSAGAALGMAALESFAMGLRPGSNLPCSEEMQFKAAKELRELNGVQVIKKSEHSVQVTDNRTLAEVRAARLAKAQALEELRGRKQEALPAPDVVDAEFEDLTLGEEIMRHVLN